MNCKIFIATHTDFECPVKNPVYEILDVRKLFPNDKAPNGVDGLFYSELLSYKYVADNYDIPEYIGFCGYRKYFEWMDDIPDIPTLVDKHGCIAVEYHTRPRSIYKQYAKSFCFADMDITMSIMSSLYPNLYPTFKKMLEGNLLHPFNMFIMHRKDFIEMMNVVWNVLDHFIEVVGTDIVARIKSHPVLYMKKKGIAGTMAHQYRIGGNIGERIVSAYIMHHFPNAKTYPAVFIGNKKSYKQLFNQ